MFRVSASTARPAGGLLAAGLLGLVLAAAGPARGQQQGQGPTAEFPRFFIGIAVDAKIDKEVADDAAKYFEGAKTGQDDKAKKIKEAEEKRAKDSLPPGYPNPEMEKPAGPNPADVAAAAALPPLGLGEAVAAQLAIKRAADKPLPVMHKWVRLGGERELFILGLDDAASPHAKAAAAAREKGRTFTHPDLNWVIYSRAGATGGTPDYFVLVRQPAEEKLLTERDLSEVRPLAPNPDPDVLLMFRGAAAAEKLKNLTTEYRAAKGKPERHVVLVLNDRVGQVLVIPEPIDNGRIRVGDGLRAREQDTLVRMLRDAMANTGQ
jgi:hypothetical protein